MKKTGRRINHSIIVFTILVLYSDYSLCRTDVSLVTEHMRLIDVVSESNIYLNERIKLKIEQKSEKNSNIYNALQIYDLVNILIVTGLNHSDIAELNEYIENKKLGIELEKKYKTRLIILESMEGTLCKAIEESYYKYKYSNSSNELLKDSLYDVISKVRANVTLVCEFVNGLH